MFSKPLRLLVVPLALALLGVALAACSSNDDSPATPRAPATAEAEAPTATASAAPTEEPTATPTAGATPTPAPTPTPEAAGRSLAGVKGIVDPTNSGWPREVEGLNGIVSIAAKPLRIITASVGHDEMTLALVPNERLVAVGGATKDETYSNVASLVQEKAEISRDPEVIIAQSPDVVVTSPWFPIEVVKALQRAGIAVIQTELQQSPESRVEAILLMGYIYGEEERAFAVRRRGGGALRRPRRRNQREGSEAAGCSPSRNTRTRSGSRAGGRPRVA